MAMGVWSGTSARSMAMAPPEWIDYVPKSSGVKLSLDAPTRMVLAQRTAMMFKELVEHSPGAAG